MADRLAIAKENGENINAELVSCFAIPDLQKQFVITTLNEIDPNGLVVLNVSEIISNKLAKIQNDDDWAKLKQVMRSIISNSSGNFKYIPAISSINASIDYTRNISVQSVAKDQLVKDYNEKKPIANNVEEKISDSTKDVPINPALGNTPIGTGSNMVAPGIEEVQSQNLGDELSINDLGKKDESNLITIDSTPQTTNPGDPNASDNAPVIDIPVAPPKEEEPVKQEVALPPIPPAKEAVEVKEEKKEEKVVNEGSANVNNANPMMPDMNNNPMTQQVTQPMMQPMNQPQNIQPMMSQSNMSNNMMGGPMMQPGMMNNPQPVMPTNNYMNIDQAINDAKMMVMENVKAMVDSVFANMAENLRMKEEELRNREMMLAQREAGMMQQPQQMPMMGNMGMNNMGMTYGNMPNYYNQNPYNMNGQTQA